MICMAIIYLAIKNFSEVEIINSLGCCTIDISYSSSSSIKKTFEI